MEQGAEARSAVYETGDYNEIIEELKGWDEKETFFREVYRQRAAGEPLEPLWERADVDPRVRVWALDPGSIDPYKTEEHFFESGRNVTVSRHPRYLPFFLHRHAFFEIIYVLSGHCQEVTNDSRTELREGDICILAPEVDHGIEVFDDSVVLNVLVRYSTFADVFYNVIRDKGQIAAFFLVFVVTGEVNSVQIVGGAKFFH